MTQWKWMGRTGWLLLAVLLATPAQSAPAQNMLCDPAKGSAAERDACLETRTRALAMDVASALSQDIASGLLEVEVRQRRLVIRLLDRDAFPPESATLRAGAVAALGRVRAALGQVSGNVSVEGHTDDVPVATARFRSNWELSAARASAVLLELVERGADPARYQVVGYGQARPLGPNDTAQNRARNRRVEIVIDATVP